MYTGIVLPVATGWAADSSKMAISKDGFPVEIDDDDITNSALGLWESYIADAESDTYIDISNFIIPADPDDDDNLNE